MVDMPDGCALAGLLRRACRSHRRARKLLLDRMQALGNNHIAGSLPKRALRARCGSRERLLSPPVRRENVRFFMGLAHKEKGRASKTWGEDGTTRAVLSCREYNE